MKTKSMASALPASAIALPSSKPSSVLLWAACGYFLLMHLGQLFPRSCPCADNSQEFACEILSACDLSRTWRCSLAVSMLQERTQSLWEAWMPRQSHLLSHHIALLAWSSTSWEGLRQAERRYTLFLCAYLGRLKSQLHNFGTRSCR